VVDEENGTFKHEEKGKIKQFTRHVSGGESGGQLSMSQQEVVSSYLLFITETQFMLHDTHVASVTKRYDDVVSRQTLRFVTENKLQIKN